MSAVQSSPLVQMLMAHMTQQALTPPASAPAAVAPAPRAKAAPKMSEFGKVLSGLNTAFGGSPTDQSHTALMGFLSALGAQSGPHMLTPVPLTEAVSKAALQAPNYQQRAAGSQITQEAALPFQVARTKEFQDALSAQGNPNLPPAQRNDAASIGLQFAGVKPQEVPSLAGAITHAQSVNKPTSVGPGTRVMGPVGAPSVGAQGTLPTATTQAPGGGPLRILPGALPALAGTSGATAGGAAQATYPFQQGIKTTGYFSSPLTNVSGFNAPPAPQLNLNSLYPGAQGQQAPGTPVPVAAQGNPQARAAIGLAHPGIAPAAAAAQSSVGKETGSAVNESNADAEDARKQIALYGQMQTDLSKMGNLGAWRDVSTAMGHLANYFGFTPMNIQSAAQFNKQRVQIIGAVTHGVSPRASTQEMDFLAQQVPNYNLPGNSAHVLVSELTGLAQYKVLRSNALTAYLQSKAGKGQGAFNGTSLGFEKWWTNNGPSPSAVVTASILRSMSPDQRIEYIRNLRKTATGRHMLNQYSRAEKFEAQYPSVFQGA